jgi:hypothetical protein
VPASCDRAAAATMDTGSTLDDAVLAAPLA